MPPTTFASNKELMATCSLYDENIDRWNFYGLAYEGGMPFIKKALDQHPRESNKNWTQRIKEGVNFNYSAIVIDLFAYYLTEKNPARELGSLSDDELYKMFVNDCDLYGSDFSIWINDCQKLAGIYGHVGILVDKPNAQGPLSREKALADRVYPYVCAYTPPHILDWDFQRDPQSGRPKLVYLKLRDLNEEILVWRPDSWERWKTGEEAPEKIASGVNPLGEIPFVWMKNIKDTTYPYMGISDLKEIAYINASLIRNVSCGDEVIKFAGFPMLRAPMEKDDDIGKKTSNDIVGPRGVLEFDPTVPESKPDWLESAVKDPIDAILIWIGKKISEIYQIAHLSGMHAHEKSDQVRSGVALRYEFAQLTRVLSKKTANLNDAEQQIIKFWLKWQGKEDILNKISVKRPTDFSVDDLSQNLENYIIAMENVKSDRYRREIQKNIARQTLPDLSDAVVNEIIDEIDNSTPTDDNDDEPPTTEPE